MVGFENFKYTRVAQERKIELIDLNREAKYKIVPMINYDLHAQPCRMAARLFDPDAYIISPAC